MPKEQRQNDSIEIKAPLSAKQPPSNASDLQMATNSNQLVSIEMQASPTSECTSSEMTDVIDLQINQNDEVKYFLP